MQKHPASKSSSNLVLLKHHKSKHPPSNQKLSLRTSLQQRFKKTDEFLKPQKYLKPLTKSAQQPSHNMLFKNSQIKKSIELHKNHTGRRGQKSKQDIKSMASQQKCNRDAYYGNTTTSQTKSIKKSQKSKLSQKSKNSSYKIAVKHQKIHQTKKHSQSSVQQHLRSPPALSRKKQTSLKKKQHRRLKKLEQQYVKMLQQKLQQKEAELNTIRTRNMLQEARGVGGWADGLSQEEMRRLRKIHRAEEDIYQLKINQVRREILQLGDKEVNDVLCFGGYECEDVLSFIQGKD